MTTGVTKRIYIQQLISGGIFIKSNFTIECLPEKTFLVIKGIGYMYDQGVAPNENHEEDAWGIIQRHISDGTVERLKKNAGSETVYMLLCNTCVRNNDKKRYDVSYEIACEYLSELKIEDGFGIVRLKPNEYAAYDIEFNGGYTLSDAHEIPDEIFWGEWLKENPYTSEIDDPANWLGNGYASIERYTPFNPNADRFNAKIWYPIKRKTT